MSVPLTLRARKPGYAVMQRCLELQAAAPARSSWQRFRGVDVLVPEARSWYKGALGERRVAAVLDELGPEFTVLHAVPVGSGASDIDHVVIGPTGVFCINTKNHADHTVWVGGGTLMVNGQRTPHVHRALDEGARASRLLSAAAVSDVAVQPLLVIESASLRFGKKVPAVVTLRPQELGRWISGLERAWSNEATRYLAMVAEERATWHVESLVITDTLRHVQRFERLERDIAQAAAQRRFFRKAVVLAVLAVPAGGLLGYWWAVAAEALQNAA
ncbi:hypothetical protein ASG04_14460 [Curtobacterium sp. Leaf183]|uniref:nuclease-related domain-containing protein n=1 Tax=Curtobacterium sp. Leaf183 TaxID=1736291 RepID=UPI0006F615DF|nr:nuclease-related domain-containing protein [Curtobacterium sp. Leaf183]KQS08305.1 hypothetical protein ASG04_14460 [Curtobacterium sp. Leaf183]